MGGVPQTFTTAFPALLKLASRPELQRLVGHFPGRPHEMPPREDVDEKALQWNVCPYCHLMGTAFERRILAVDRYANVSPLAGWPDQYPAWVTEGVAALRQFRESRKQKK